MAESMENYFMVWGADRSPYGPVELPTLVSWVEDGRVTPESWVFVGINGTWRRARTIAELKSLFGVTGDTTRLQAPPQIDPQTLRSIKILAGLTDPQLDAFARLVEIEQIPEGALILSQGQRDDFLFFILEGEVRVCLPVMGKDETLTTLATGDFFGDMALLNHGERCADIIANTNCVLAKLSAGGLEKIIKGAPDTATPFLRAMDQALTERIRADNQRFAGIMASARQHP